MTNPLFETPRILILDDDPVQIMTVHMQLKGLGQFVDFTHPELAIEYIKTQPVDAAVVDIRMPNNEHDGLWFLATLRTFDKHLGVILRTADEDVEIAQAGIEARAIQRIIKGLPNSKEVLREATANAIMETRDHRKIEDLETAANRIKEELVHSLGENLEELTVAAACKGFISNLASPITALHGYAELLRNHPTPHNRALVELIEKNYTTSCHLTQMLEAFISDPFLEIYEPLQNTSLNACLNALQRSITNSPLTKDRKCNLHARILEEKILRVNPKKLLVALRQLVEYALIKTPPDTEITLQILTGPINQDECLKNGMLLNRRRIPSGPTTQLRLTTNFQMANKDLSQAFNRSPEDPKHANLLLTASVILEEGLALIIERKKDYIASITLIIP